MEKNKMKINKKRKLHAPKIEIFNLVVDLSTIFKCLK